MCCFVKCFFYLNVNLNVHYSSDKKSSSESILSSDEVQLKISSTDSIDELQSELDKLETDAPKRYKAKNQTKLLTPNAHNFYGTD